MKFYHFGLVFAVIAAGIIVTTQIYLVTAMKEEEIRRIEYDSLVSAVNAAVETAFEGTENIVTAGSLQQAAEAFFHTLSVLHGGLPDAVGRAKWQEYVPCLAVFDEQGYYCYGYVEGKGYEWSELTPYQGEGIPKVFFSETEKLLSQYHGIHYSSKKTYRMESAQTGIWEQSLSRACVFAIYAPPVLQRLKKTQGIYLYASTGRTKETYFVTEDNYCHLPSCGRYEKEKIVARYVSQKESAIDGAIPCEYCLK